MVIDETATELVNSGKLTGQETDDEFAEMIVEHQLQKEFQTEKDAQNGNDKYVIICDRSAIEPAAYVGIKKVSSVLSKHGVSFESVRNSYDLVVHLTTAAKGASEFYTLENNEARNESLSQAISLDDSIMQIWSNHPNRVIVNNDQIAFEDKMKKVKDLIINYVKNKQ